jgi:hypothetical protein
MKKTSSFLTGFLAMLVAAGLLSSAGTAQAALVYSANFASGTISSWNTSNPGAGAITILSGITGPIGVATDSLGNIYVSSTGNGGEIRKYTQSGSFLTSLAGIGTTFALAFDSSDNLYYNGVDLNGTYKTTTSLTSDILFASGSTPTGMFIDASGNVSVMNLNGDGTFPYVSTWSSGGSLLTSFTNGALYNPMDTSHGVTRDAAGNYYVSNRDDNLNGNFYISKWDSSGTLVNGTYINTGYDAYGMLVDGSTLFVADHGGGRIAYYDLANNGNYLGDFSVGASPTYMNFATTAPVPEPGTWAAAALLAGGAAFMRWRKRAKVA